MRLSSSAARAFHRFAADLPSTALSDMTMAPHSGQRTAHLWAQMHARGRMPPQNGQGLSFVIFITAEPVEDDVHLLARLAERLAAGDGVVDALDRHLHDLVRLAGNDC